MPVTDIGGIPMVQTGGYGGYGDGGGGWMGMLLVIALLGGRGFGFGGRDGERDGCGNSCCDKELQLINDNMNSRFNDTNASINQMADLAFQRETAEQLGGISKDIWATSSNLAREVGQIGFNQAIIAKDAQISALECCCTTNRNIDQLRFDDAKGFSGLEHMMDKCCCETNRNIDSVKFQNERDTCAILQNASANTQRIIDWLSCNELKEANAEIAKLNAEKNKLEIIGAMKPREAVPAYLQPSPYQAYTTMPYPYPFGFQNNKCEGFNNCGNAFA